MSEMAIVTDQATYERILRSRSLILAYDPNKRGSQKQPPTSTKMLDLTEEGIKRQLYELNSEDRNALGDFIGYLPAKRSELREAIADWGKYKSAQPLMAIEEKPVGIWLERINRIKAQIKVAEEESRKLNQLLTALHRRAAAHEPGPREQRALASHVKYRDGKIWKVAGRQVVQDEKGRDVFEDDGTLVSDYLLGLSKKKKKGEADE